MYGYKSIYFFLTYTYELGKIYAKQEKTRVKVSCSVSNGTLFEATITR